MSLKALALNGTLKSSDSSEPFSSGKLLERINEEFMKHGVVDRNHSICRSQYQVGRMRRRRLAGHP
ncbi:hypothetical protein ACVMH6_001972 [Rhizobium leguminosarum]|nr:hypothetical protein [Rhizobium leguminosarum]